MISPVVGTPGQSVRDANIFPVNRDTVIRIQAIENPLLATSLAGRAIGVHVVAHGADPKRTSRIRTPFVQTNFGPPLEPEPVLVPNVGGRLPQDHARAEDHREDVIPFRQGEGGYRLTEKPCTDALVVWRETMNQEAVDVGPVHGRMGCMPNSAFAASVTGRSNANRL